MAHSALKKNSDYAGSCIVLITKHAKSIAIAPVFLKKLKATVTECVKDTDHFGTFSGEKIRAESALECARKKCEWAFEEGNDTVEYALANEGSFGPHPLIPFIPCNHEILYFIDRKRDFHLSVSHLSEKTNYRMEAVHSLEALQTFAQKVLFPSHALILRPDNRETKSPLFKGINSQKALEEAFKESLNHSTTGTVWVETDMRALFNPSRMKVIGELAATLAERLALQCPQCKTPGWGKIRLEKGLPCSWCNAETEVIKSEIFGCTKCHYEEKMKRSDNLKETDPSNCHSCNP